MKRIAIFTVSILLLAGCATSEQRLQRRAEREAAVAEMISNKSFKIRADHMYPQRYPSRPVMSEFWLQLHDGVLNSYLPFFGQVHTPSMLTPSQGLNFEAPVLAFDESRNDRKQYTEFDICVRSDEDAYLYVVTIYDNGNAEIYVRGNNRDYIRFTGEIEEE